MYILYVGNVWLKKAFQTVAPDDKYKLVRGLIRNKAMGIEGSSETFDSEANRLHMRQRSRVLTGAAFGLVLGCAVVTAIFTPEIYIGTNILLRIFFGISCAFSAAAFCFGLLKLASFFPLRISATLFGAGIVVTCLVYCVLSAFPILPFGASRVLTFCASALVCAVILMLAMSIGGLMAVQNKLTTAAILLIAFALTGSVVLLGRPAIDNAAAVSGASLLPEQTMNNLSRPDAYGNHIVKLLFYGSGTDKRRPEFGDRVDLRTECVDASPFIPKGWSFARTSYWGFDFTQLPINGRVWFPEGDGPFPLVLIVHGAHNMTEFSDPGFAYIGALLASRGYIVASIDENFFNYGWYQYGDFEESDIDARAWLILQHLVVWQKWNKSEKGLFSGKVDMSRIALIGHSRGGEAIAAAASFNRMGRYPKNGSISFKFNFDIRTLIALSPSDTYQPPYERSTPTFIRNVNYLLLQGTHDRDVPSIVGSRVYQRVIFTDNREGSDHALVDNKFRHYMKAALYIYRANHSQFNTVWGVYDFPWPHRLFENTATQLRGEEQRQIAKIYVSAFLDATLRGKRSYIPIFRDYRLIKKWLPETAFISRFQDSSFHIISDFDDDIDPAMTTVEGGKIIGQNLAEWYEQDIDYHYYMAYGSRSNRVVFLKWESMGNNVPIYGLKLPQKKVKSWRLKPEDMLVFSIAFPDQQSVPDLSIEVSDEKGGSARLPLSRVFTLTPLRSHLTRLGMIEEPSPQIFLQTISIPLVRFTDINPSFNLRQLQSIDFRFDRSGSGAVFLDDIGVNQ